MQSLAKLEEIEWHDLPLDGLSINEGSIEIRVSAIIDGSNSYRQFTLDLSKFTDCNINISSVLNHEVLKELEVAKFDYTEESGLLSGSIGILPGNTGYWSINFKNAKWCLNETT